MTLRKLSLLLIAVAAVFSCSSDKENVVDENSILGTWDLTALEIDEATATDDMEFGQDILDFLTAQQCYIVTLTFNEDLSVITENSADYLQINVNPGGTGLDVPCPTEKDTDASTYTFDGEVLTYIDDNLETVTVSIEISGNTMTVSAIDLGIDNFDDGGQLIFTKR